MSVKLALEIIVVGCSVAYSTVPHVEVLSTTFGHVIVDLAIWAICIDELLKKGSLRPH